MPPGRPAPVGEIYQLKVTLREVKPPVWRRLEVGAATTLARLHETLQVVLGWGNSHLHEFRVGGVAYGEPDPDGIYDRDVKDDRRARLNKIAPTIGSTFIYIYDFGDGWTHDVIVEAIAPPKPRVLYPRVIDGARACPPDDVGGPPGYDRFRAAIADPSHPEHGDMVAWIGEPFDPGAFDVDEVNRMLDLGFKFLYPDDDQ